MKTMIETGLNIHYYFIRDLKNQMKGRILVRQLNLHFDTEKGTDEHGAITLDYTFRNAFLVVLIGYVFSFIMIILEITSIISQPKILQYESAPPVVPTLNERRRRRESRALLARKKPIHLP